MEEAVALTAAANTIIQDADSVGNALKTVSMRIRGTTTKELEAAGEDTDGLVENTSKLYSKIKALTAVNGKEGISILGEDGKFLNTYEILTKIADRWEEITKAGNDAPLLELLAGKTRGSVVAALLQQPEILKSAYEDAFNAEGSAIRENEVYLDSIQGKIDQFTNAVQTMWNNTLDDSWIKSFVSFGTIIIQTIDRIGLLTTALIALGAVSMIKNKTGPIVFLQDLTKFATDANIKIANFPKTINTLVQGTQRLTSATLEQAVANGSLTTSEAIRQATMSGLVLSQVSLTAEEAKALLATTALNEVEQQNIITKLGLSSSSQKVTLAMLQQAVATGKLTASEATQMALATGLVAKETALTAARATKILTTNGVATSEAQAIVSALGLGKAIQTLTLATIQQAIANGTLTASQGAAAMSLLVTQGAATGLIGVLGTLKALLASIWPLLVIGGAIFAIVKIVDAVVTTTEELEEELSGLKSELSDIQSELDSVNNELKTTQERMDELLSKGTLSFTEEEELKQLKKTNDELQREIDLQKILQNSKQKEVNKKFKETMETQLEEGYVKDNSDGLVGAYTKKASWIDKLFGFHVVDNKTALKTNIDKYQEYVKLNKRFKESAIEAQVVLDDDNSSWPDKQVAKMQIASYEDSDKILGKLEQSITEQLQKYKDEIEDIEYGDDVDVNNYLDYVNNMLDRWAVVGQQATDAKANAVNRIFNKEQFAEISDEIDKLVEKLKKDPGNTAYEQKIRDIISSNKELQNNLEESGVSIDDAVKSFAKFSSGFDSDSIDGITEQYQNAIDVLRRITIDRLEIEKELKQYAHGGTVDLLNRPLVDASELSKVGWENAGEGTATVFSSTYSNENGTIAVNFTPILPDGSRVLGPDELQRYAEDVISGVRQDDLNLQIGATFEGEDAIDQAVNAAEEIHNLQDMYYLPIKVELDDGTTEEIKWDDLFEWDEASKQWKAQSTQFAKILKDTDETLRQEFITLAENIKNNKISIEDAVNSLELSGLIRITKLTENTLSTLNTDMFADVKDDISGLIDTFSELGSALESTASAMDLLHSAQQQMNNSGRISVKTALELIESTDNWEKILTVTGNTITLNSDAEQVLIGTKLQLIEKNIDLALSQAQLQLAQIEGTEATLENAEADLITVEAQKTYDNAMLQSSAVSAGLGAAVGVLVQKLNALRNLDFDNSALNTSLFDAFNSAYDSVITLSTSTVDAAVTADELRQKISDLQTQKNLISQVNTSGNFKNYYDYEKKPGDKYTDKNSESALEKLKKKYENQISLLENQKTYIENEISRLEAEDKQVGKALYEEQIRLEKEKLALYDKEREQLLAQMSTVAKDSDEWYEYANAVWDVEHAIQDTTLSVVELKDKITQLYVDVFGKIEDAFENQQKLYDYRQQYIRNNIEYAELLDQPVSADSYKKLYYNQQDAMFSAQKQAESLQNTLNKGLADGSIKEGSEEFVDLQYRIYDAKIEAQEARNEMVNINDELKKLYITAFDKVKEVYDALDNLYSDRQQYAETYMEYMKLIDEDNGLSVSKDTYTYLIDQENNKLQANMQELESLRAKLTDAVNNGDVTVGSEEWIELESNIRETEYAILENKKALEEYNKELKQLYVDAFNNVKDAFGNKNDIYEDQQSYIEGYMDYLEALGIEVPTEMYDKLIAVEEEKKEANLQQLDALRNKLSDMEANGYTADDEEWVQAQADIRACEKAILDSDIATAKWNKTIQEMNTEKFEEFIKRIEHTISELENVYDLLSKKDVADEQGNWTEEGITALGLMYQKLQIAQRESKEYADEIEKLNRQYESGEISEQDYTDRLIELKDAQWDSIKSYEDAKDAIVDLNEARVDMIEDGIQKEIEAFEELIQLKKDELSAEKDLYDFRKNIQSQTKDIATLERKIAAMSGSTDAATIAERSKLETQLREAKESLNDTYYDHAMDSQSSAYDDELDSYTKSKEDYVEQLREALKDVEKIVADSMAQVLINADAVLNGLNNVSSEYGVTLSDQLMLPWQNAAAKVEEYRSMLSLTMEDFLLQNGIFSGEITDQINQLFGQGSASATGFEEVVNTVISNIRTSVEESTSPLTDNLTLPFDTAKDRAQNTFSPQVMAAIDAVAQKAAEKSPDEKNNLTYPWEQAEEAANTFGTEAEDAIQQAADKAAEYSPTLTEDLTIPPEEASTQWGLFGSKVATVLSQMIKNAQDAADQIGDDMQAIIKDAQRAADAIANTGSSGTGSGNGNGGSGGNTTTNSTTPTVSPIGNKSKTPSESDVKALQSVLNSLFRAGLTVNGKLGFATSAAIKNAQRTMYQNGNETMKVQDGLYSKATRAAMIDYINKKIDNLREQGGSSMMGQGIQKYTEMRQKLPKAFYAKGTMGTPRDQWAITDEPQYGDELVLIPSASGNLSYMRKGTSVVPADITKRIFDLAQTPTNELGNNLIKVSIPDISTNNNIELTFDTLLKVENATKETIPELKKLVQEQLDIFARKLNYGIKRVGQ